MFKWLGWNRYSIGYFSNNGNKCFSSPFNSKQYGLPFKHGDVIGVGYRHRTGSIFFTRNGRKLEEAYAGLRWNLFPTIGANGPCQVHVNLGQAGFVFVEANVKKWGLAQRQGTLAPPPMYGNHQDTILLAMGATSTADNDNNNNNASMLIDMNGLTHNTANSYRPPPYNHHTHHINNTSSTNQQQQQQRSNLLD